MSNTSSAGKIPMEEGLDQSPLNVESVPKSVSSATHTASQDGTDSAWTVTLAVLMKQAGEMMDFTAEDMNMEEELDILGAGLKLTTMEGLTDAEMTVILKDVRCIGEWLTQGAILDTIPLSAVFADPMFLTALPMG